MIKRENRPFSEVLLEKFAFKSEGGGGVIKLPDEVLSKLDGVVSTVWNIGQEITSLAKTFEFPKGGDGIMEQDVQGIPFTIQRQGVGEWTIEGKRPVTSLNFTNPYTDASSTINIYMSYLPTSYDIAEVGREGDSFNIFLNMALLSSATQLRSSLTHEIAHAIDPKFQRDDWEKFYDTSVPGGTPEYYLSPMEFDARITELVNGIKHYFKLTGEQFGGQEVAQQLEEFRSSLSTNPFGAISSFFAGNKLFPLDSYIEPFLYYLEKGDENLKKQVLQKLYRATEEVRTEISNY